jgi:hypothetical protein
LLDNAVAESFFATIKGEMIDHEYYQTRAAAIAAMKPLPEPHDPILVEGFVDAHYGEATFEGLGSEQPIEWIAMVKTAA